MNNCTTDCCECKAAAKRGTHAVYGRTEDGLGRIHRWLLFIDAKLPLEEAKVEAIRIQLAWCKGCVVRCWSAFAETAEQCRERLAGRPRSLSLSQLSA